MGACQAYYGVKGHTVREGRFPNKKTGLNAKGEEVEYRVVGDSKVPNSLTKDISFPTAHLEDTRWLVVISRFARGSCLLMCVWSFAKKV